MTSCRTYSPYGAWELKRTYQRNLLLANLAVLVLVATAVGIPSILIPPPDIEARSGGGEADTVEIVSHVGPPPVVISDPFDGPPVKPPRELVGSIPVPIVDSLFPDDDVPAIASQQELAQLYNYRADQFDRHRGNAVFGTETVEELIPDIDSFMTVDIQPEMIHQVAPDYPRHARQAGLEGDVWVAALVGIKGEVREVRIRKSSEIAILDRAAEEAAWKCKYRPAVRANQPVLIWVTYKVAFRLNE